MCGSTCVSTDEDGNNCGVCDVACTTGQSCMDGNCQEPDGGDGKEPCKDELQRGVSTDEDGNNCGVCDVACTTGQSCMDGNCQEPDGGDGKETCEDGLKMCGSTCVSTDEDGNNCGKCGMTCTVSQSCIGGSCQELTVDSIELELDKELHKCILDMATTTGRTLVREVKEINCLGRNIKSAQGLQPFVQVQRLDLYNNQITTIAEDTFAGLTKLEQLFLSGNQIKEIKANTFAGLEKLEVLDLNGNEIKEIKANTFAGLTKLEGLSLYNNKIGEIKKDTFAGLTKLEELYLSRNKITTIAENAFAGLTKLERLYLHSNRDVNGEPTLSCGSLLALLNELRKRTTLDVFLEDATNSYDYSETQSEDSLETDRYCKRD